ncbi:hypothetical protein L596_010477 [Steinernema carpocapsae]|uniref:Uncharacterized protein n=1 Tax=Steinernema carpocapsae TaxID=34508 RepID=A0A4U5PIF1_STECR|nr:hypothetical protein L596_010477 [Steinernema carpocapsae]
MTPLCLASEQFAPPCMRSETSFIMVYGHFYVALVAPFIAPAVLHDPVVQASDIVGTVAYEQNCVMCIRHRCKRLKNQKHSSKNT